MTIVTGLCRCLLLLTFESASLRQSLNDSRPDTPHNQAVRVWVCVCVCVGVCVCTGIESCNRELYYHLFPHMLICLYVTSMSFSIALLFSLSPTLCLFQSPLPLCPLLHAASLPRVEGLGPSNK